MHKYIKILLTLVITSVFLSAAANHVQSALVANNVGGNPQKIIIDQIAQARGANNFLQTKHNRVQQAVAAAPVEVGQVLPNDEIDFSQAAHAGVIAKRPQSQNTPQQVATNLENDNEIDFGAAANTGVLHTTVKKSNNSGKYHGRAEVDANGNIQLFVESPNGERANIALDQPDNRMAMVAYDPHFAAQQKAAAIKAQADMRQPMQDMAMVAYDPHFAAQQKAAAMKAQADMSQQQNFGLIQLPKNPPLVDYNHQTQSPKICEKSCNVIARSNIQDVFQSVCTADFGPLTDEFKNKARAALPDTRFVDASDCTKENIFKLMRDHPNTSFVPGFFSTQKYYEACMAQCVQGNNALKLNIYDSKNPLVRATMVVMENPDDICQ